MFIAIALIILIPLSYAQTDLDHYVKRFKLKSLEVPAKNKALYDLGFKLFYDKNLSGNNNISCQTCHSLTGFSADALPLGLGEGAVGIANERFQRDGLVLGRNTPAIYNLSLPGVRAMFWDGRVSRDFDGKWITPDPLQPKVASTLSSLLAVQSIFPLVNPEEMMGKSSKLSSQEGWDLVMKKVFEGPFKATYKKMFSEAFPGESDFNIGHVGNAMAELMRHHFMGHNTLWDMYLRGRKEVLSERMKRGAVLFHTRANCTFCHNGDHFTNWDFQNIGSPQIGPDDKGRFNVTKNYGDLYKFRVAPLRNVGLTGPYMHSGAFKTLWEVIDHYEDPVSSLRNFKWDGNLKNYRDSLKLDTDSVNNDTRERNLSRLLPRMLKLTPDEKSDLVCFLAVALTDVSLQMDLIKKGVVNEISDCSPRPY